MKLIKIAVLAFLLAQVSFGLTPNFILGTLRKAMDSMLDEERNVRLCIAEGMLNNNKTQIESCGISAHRACEIIEPLIVKPLPIAGTVLDMTNQLWSRLHFWDICDFLVPPHPSTTTTTTSPTDTPKPPSLTLAEATELILAVSKALGDAEDEPIACALQAIYESSEEHLEHCGIPVQTACDILVPKIMEAIPSIVGTASDAVDKVWNTYRLLKLCDPVAS